MAIDIHHSHRITIPDSDQDRPLIIEHQHKGGTKEHSHVFTTNATMRFCKECGWDMDDVDDDPAGHKEHHRIIRERHEWFARARHGLRR